MTRPAGNPPKTGAVENMVVRVMAGQMAKHAKDAAYMTLGALIMAIGTHFFKFPNHFTFGGVTGFAVLAEKTGLVSAGGFTLVCNMVLLLLGFASMGRKFGLKTFYVSLLLSGLLLVLQRFFPMSGPLTDSPMLELVFAIALPALGTAILFHAGASSGGTDIIAMFLKQRTQTDIGKALFFTDLLGAAAACFLFDIKTGLYSLLGLTVKSLLVDSVMDNMNLCKYFNVVCDDPEPVCDYIIRTLGRSATVCAAKGAFSHGDKYIVFTVLNRQEALRLKLFLTQALPSSFIFVANTSEIIGQNFRST